MVKAVVEHKTLTVDPVLRERPYNVDLARHEGRLYSIKAPGPSLLAIPFYYVATALTKLTPAQETLLMRLVASTIPALIFLLFFFRFTAFLSPNFSLRLLVLLGLAVGSMYYTHALLLAGHETAAVGLAGAFLSAFFNKRRPKDSPFLLFMAGFLLALGASSEYQSFFAALAIGVYAFFATKRKIFFGFFLLGALPFSFLTALVHYLSYGSPFLTGHHFPAEPAFQQYQHCGWRGLFCFSWAGLYGTFFAASNGLFFFAPWLVFALPGLVFLLSDRTLRTEGVCITVVIASYFVVISSMYAWKGGWSVGPRYLGATMPFLAMACLYGLDLLHRRNRIFFWLFVPLWLVGIFIYGLSSPIFPHFPEDLSNPFFDFLLPLIQMRFFPYNVGQLFGLHGLAGVLPFLIVFAFLVLSVAFSVLRTCEVRISVAIIKLLLLSAVAAALLFAMSKVSPSDPAVVARNLRLAEHVWEPRPAGTEHAP